MMRESRALANYLATARHYRPDRYLTRLERPARLLEGHAHQLLWLNREHL